MWKQTHSKLRSATPRGTRDACDFRRAASTVSFIGSVYGGPVIMATAAFPEGVYVDAPGRFGIFGATWVKRFFGEEL